MSGEDESEEVVKGDSFEVKPFFIVQRSPGTAFASADYAKYMVDPDCGMGTLIFFRKYVTPKKDSKGWQPQEVVEESFLEVKLPLNTLATLVLGLHKVFVKDLKQPRAENSTFFGPSKVLRRPEGEPE